MWSSGCHIIICRKALLPHSETIKKKLKMTSEGSISKLHHKFSVSYSVRKRRFAQLQEPTVTETTVGLDDNYLAEVVDESAVDADSAGTNTNEELEIHTS